MPMLVIVLIPCCTSLHFCVLLEQGLHPVKAQHVMHCCTQLAGS